VPIRDWPEAIRPRERLIRDGPPALSDAQLLAIVIGSGTKRRSALAIAEALVHSSGGLGGLARADLSALRVGAATSARIVAALELGRRALAAEREGEVLDTPDRAARALAPHLAHRDREALVVALLTRKQRLIAVTPIYTGNVAGTSVRIGELFTDALRRNAAGILLGHNHPSGDPEPSADDLRTTRDAVAAGRLLGVSVVDHVIIGAGRHVSLRERGALA
jgi:DNA repair protein RadC